MDNNMNPFNGGNGNGSGNGSQGPNGSGGSGQNNPRRTSLILLAIAAIVTLISMSLFMRMINNATNQEITYGKFQELVEDGKAAEVTWDDDTIYLKLQQTNQKTLFSAMPEVTYYTGKAQSDCKLRQGCSGQLRTDFDDDPDLCASDCRYVAAFKSAISADGRRRPDGRRQEQRKGLCTERNRNYV